MKNQISSFLIYLKAEKNYAQDTTIKNYEIDLEQFANFLKANHLNYLKLTKEDIRSYLKYLDGLEYKNSSIARHLSALRSFYAYLVNNGVLKTNIFKTISSPKKEKKLPNFLQYSEFEDMLNVWDVTIPLEHRNRLIIETLYNTGARVSELVNIKLNDIDLNKHEIRVLGKGSKERIVYFGDYEEDILGSYLKASRPKLLKDKHNNYLF